MSDKMLVPVQVYKDYIRIQKIYLKLSLGLFIINCIIYYLGQDYHRVMAIVALIVTAFVTFYIQKQIEDAEAILHNKDNVFI